MPVILRYCDRAGPWAWAEPPNAASSLAFVVAVVVLA